MKSKSNEEEDIPDVQRQFYDQIKINNQGRNKQEGDHNKGGMLGLLEEVVTWAITANVPEEQKERHRSISD